MASVEAALERLTNEVSAMRLDIAELSTKVALLNEGRNHHKEGIDAAHRDIRTLKEDVAVLKEKEVLNEKVRSLAWALVVAAAIGSFSLLAMAYVSIRDSYGENSAKSHIENSK